ncbi:heme biosynthesis protein HemY [Hydrogenovibrio sp. SC-1]|uniref:heme biosynthesis HemY N-terminal domain-containing protein n=1 Tax=Hydrogenovibrio sp. SC-1 TaxID=2065820 RepID=UPI000C7967CA|nr:heme biosynthesis HemY N-terminal domain-containing protein [Hydrogenovibrio sp. SC-1]PLA75275.1 heme biosynthesis protein HemY [Hydrogenovibrio sp. SC-1]
MSGLIKWSLGLILATGLTSLALMDTGQVSMVWHDWVIETSLTFGIALILGGFFAVYVMIRLIIGIWHLPAYWRNRRELKRFNQTEASLSKGLIALEYGDWHQAEKQLVKMAKTSHAGLVHYLNAAKMAHNQGASDRQAKYLDQARQAFPEESVTIGLVESRLIKASDPEMALVVLAEIHQQAPKNTVILNEYAQLLEAQAHWETLAQLLPELRKTKALDKPALLALESRLIAGKLAHATELESLEALWQPLTQAQKLNSVILAEYIEQKIHFTDWQGLSEIIEKSLSKQWDDRLAYQYGRIEFGPAFTHLKRAEKWLKSQPHNPVLFLTLGRLACRGQLWGQARHYFTESLKLRPELETFHAMAKCYEAEGLESEAALTYKEAILQLEDKAPSSLKTP